MLPATLRDDFPALGRLIGGKRPVYFDNACMTMKPRPVLDAMQGYYELYPSCGGRSTHKFAREVSDRVDEAREALARYLGARSASEIVFTRNTTEAINLAAWGLGLKKGDRVLTTDREHNSNLAPWHLAKERLGIRHEVVRSNPDMTFSLENLKEAMGPDVRLVSMVHTSNLDGYTLPARDIVEIAHDNGALVLLDGAQSAAHHPVDVGELDVDLFALSAHKMCGPTGMGALYGKAEVLASMRPFIAGGDTVANTTFDGSEFLLPPQRFEGGLQNYAGIIGTGAAADYLRRIGLDRIHEHELDLSRRVAERLEGVDGVVRVGPPHVEDRGGIFSFNIGQMSPHDVAMILDETDNIFLRAGQLCVHSWFDAYGRSFSCPDGVARASFYLYNTPQEVDLFCSRVAEIAGSFG